MWKVLISQTEIKDLPKLHEKVSQKSFLLSDVSATVLNNMLGNYRMDAKIPNEQGKKLKVKRQTTPRDVRATE